MICEGIVNGLKCGCHDRVMRTVQRDGRIFRIRRCPACGHSMETEEKPLEPVPVVEPRKKTKKRNNDAKASSGVVVRSAT